MTSDIARYLEDENVDLAFTVDFTIRDGSPGDYFTPSEAPCIEDATFTATEVTIYGDAGEIVGTHDLTVLPAARKHWSGYLAAEYRTSRGFAEGVDAECLETVEV